eukprot:TRINITY_DN75514_c0_g1_i1.p1 TRINITY_DN75514_c0_g1~~TRINITY_DN75514_c0_g1_i1.p1  ORF type:complete len:326 (+),score=51.97 TRINITY_DN75514_c0_g1_i1:193-1170(+)
MAACFAPCLPSTWRAPPKKSKKSLRRAASFVTYGPAALQRARDYRKKVSSREELTHRLVDTALDEEFGPQCRWCGVRVGQDTAHDCVVGSRAPDEIHKLYEVQGDASLQHTPFVEVFLPISGASSGVGAVVFGGGDLVDLGGEEAEGLAQRLADEYDLIAFNVRYRLAPEAAHPAQIDDARSALQMMLNRDDVKHVGVFGSSAGGYLAAYLATSFPERIAFQVLCYPCIDPLCAHEPWTGFSYERHPKRSLLEGLVPVAERLPRALIVIPEDDDCCYPSEHAVPYGKILKDRATLVWRSGGHGGGFDGNWNDLGSFLHALQLGIR